MKKLFLIVAMLLFAALYNATVRAIDNGGGNPLAIDTTIQYRGMYVTNFSRVYNNRDSAAATFNFIKQQKFNHIMEYDLWKVLANDANYTTISNFNDSVKTRYGVKQVAAVVGDLSDYSNHIATYNSSQTGNGAFNYVNLESEFWNGDCTFAQYGATLRAIHNLVRKQPTPDSTELYIGWLTAGQDAQQADTLVKYADRILIHDYIKTPNFRYIEDRLNFIGMAAIRQHKVQNVVVIFDGNISRNYFKRQSLSYTFNNIKHICSITDFDGRLGVKLIGYAYFSK